MASPVPDKSPPCLCRRLGSALRIILNLWTYVWSFSLGRVFTRSAATQTETPPDWANLPDVCLLAIFAYLPTRDLLHLARVCRHWKSVQGRVCQSQTTLTVLFGPNAGTHLLACDALFDGPETTLSRRRHLARTSVTLLDPHRTYRRNLLATFPHVSQLALSVTLDLEALVPHLASLLDGWRSSLLSLKLILHFPPSYSVMDVMEYSRLLRTLKLLHLETFTLVANCRMLPTGNAQFALPFLARLRHFSLDTHDPAECLEESFEKYATANDSLQSIRLNNLAFSHGSAGNLFGRFDGNFLVKLKHLKVNVDGRRLTLQQCTLLFPSLASLTYLDFYHEGDATFQQLIECLATLSQMTHLRLFLNSNRFTRRGLDQERVVAIPQLPKLKHLFLDLSGDTDELLAQLAFYHLEVSVPALESLSVHVWFYDCFGSLNEEEDFTLPPVGYSGDDFFDEVGYSHPYPQDDLSLLTKARDDAAQVYAPVRSLQINQKTVTFEWNDFYPGKHWTLAQLSIEE